MRGVFGNVEVTTCDNALCFDRPEPLITFAEALFSFCGIAREEPCRADILTAVTAEAERWFTDHPGEVWRDPKGYTIATATVPAE